MKNKGILTFDLEFLNDGKFLSKYSSQNKSIVDDQIEKSTSMLLTLLNKYNQKSTFFVLGELAEKYPELIKKISNQGHEIASHGYSHKIISGLRKSELEEEIALSKKTIKTIISKEPIGFRAPNFSLNKKTQWAIEVIKNNFYYDSSIHPLKRNFINQEILEVSPSVGGIYFRALPLWLYCLLLKIFSKENIPVLYFHLIDLFQSLPKIENAPWWRKKIKYLGINGSLKKFEKLMKKFDFISIEKYLYKN